MSNIWKINKAKNGVLPKRMCTYEVFRVEFTVDVKRQNFIFLGTSVKRFSSLEHIFKIITY